jgi:hypothetical protein
VRIITSMKKDRTGLEDFVGRHRADFDAFEPRPDLWEALEQKLDADNQPAEAAPLRIVPLRPTVETAVRSTAPRRRYFAYGLAATLALLLLAGVGFWQLRHPAAPAWTRTGAAAIADQPLLNSAPLADDNPFKLGSEPVAQAAGAAPAQRAAAAVQRMEAYYAVQIRERQAELRRLDAQAGASADWQRELTALDSTYQQLKVELSRNPEPDVVLDAMNRNLQIRLDILNQQLRTRAQVQEYSEEAPTP